MREKFRNLPLRNGVGVIVLNQNNKVKVENKVFKVGQLVLDRKCPHNGWKNYYDIARLRGY